MRFSYLLRVRKSVLVWTGAWQEPGRMVVTSAVRGGERGWCHSLLE